MAFKAGAVLILSLLSQTSAAPVSGKSINWFDCTQNASIPIQCGSLKVPLDYTDASSNASINLQLTRVNATVQPSKGSILFNPGGPGEIGRSFITNAGGIGTALLLMTGGEYDLIAFDPRGTGETIPFVCYPPTVNGLANEYITNFKIPNTVTGSNTDPGTVFAGKGIQAEACYQNAREFGRFIGTSFVARDMMQIVEALGEDGLLRYWGFSYGTALGATFAAMFPQAIDRIVLDGVLNPDQYWSGKSIQQLVDSEEVVDGFYAGCAQYPRYCALASDGSSASQIRDKVEGLLEKVKYQPIVFGPEITTDFIDYGTLKALFWSGMYDTSLWPTLAHVFDGILSSKWNEYLRASSKLSGILSSAVYPDYAGGQVLQGIRCSDSEFRTDDLSEVMPLVDELERIAPTLCDTQATSIIIACSRWKMAAKERYTGGFTNIKTKNPLLFVGNTYDPFTPLVSAQNASAAFEGSVVLQHDGYGHTSTSQPSLCTAKHIRAFFANGTLPPVGTICPSSVPTFYDFNNITITTIMEPLANLTRRSESGIIDDDDAALLDAWLQVGRGFLNQKRAL